MIKLTMGTWLVVLGILALITLLAFLYYFMKDNQRRIEKQLPWKVLIPNMTLLFLLFVTIAVIVGVYFDWQSQINVWIP